MKCTVSVRGFSQECESDKEKKMSKLQDFIREIPDFPKEGIIFRDIMPLFGNAEGLRLATDSIKEILADVDFDLIAGSEARGFLVGAPVAYAMNKGFVSVRKKGKLPFETISADYDLEYGTATVEIQKDAIKPGQKVVLTDDLLATGGTLEAMIKLVEQLGGEVVKIVCLIELCGLEGRKKFEGYDVETLIQYPDA